MSRKMMNEDFIGTCQWCFGEFKVNARRGMVLHGYTRPGYGYTEGQCRGVGHAPFEDEHKLTDVRIKELHESVAKNERSIGHIDTGKIAKIRNPNYIPEGDAKRSNRRYRHEETHDKEFLTSEDNRFAHYLKIMRASLESEIRYDKGVIAYLDTQVSNWKKGEIVGLDSPATGRQRYVRDAFDPEKAKAEEEFLQRKAERDAKPGKITVNFYRVIPFPDRNAGLSDEEWRAAIIASHDAEEAFKKEVKAWAKARFPGKVWVGDGDDQQIRHILGHSAWNHPGGKVEVIAFKPEWQYLDDVMSMFPDAFRYDKDTNQRDPLTNHGIGKGKDIRLWVDGTELPTV
jgi:hypothetical protein